MKDKYIKDVFDEEYENEEVDLSGWVYRKRELKSHYFVDLRDSTGVIQTVVPKGEGIDLSDAGIESSLKIKGKVNKDERAPGGYEMHAEEVEVVGPSNKFPIQEDHSKSHLLDNRHLWLRSSKMSDISKIKAKTLEHSRDFFKEKGWTEVTPPILNESACEGGSSLFELEYFGDKAYLSQSAQLYLESMIQGLEEVYSLTPSFRAEKSRTKRHLSEYWHLEGEAAWTDYDEILDFQEDLISYISQELAKSSTEELKNLGRSPEKLEAVEPPFERLEYDDIIDELQGNGFDIEWGDDLSKAEERFITEDTEVPVFASLAPKEEAAFYAKENPEDDSLVLSADLLAPEGYGELTTGGQREENLDSIVRRIKNEGFDPDNYEWYLDLRRYGSVPHSGFGLGVERFLRWVCDEEDIMETIPFPRTKRRYYP